VKKVDALVSLSQNLAALVEKVGTSAVRVEARRRLPATGIIWSADGIVVTAHHVVERDDAINIGLPDGNTVPASLVGRDPTTDIAVLRVQAAGLSAPAWASPDDLRVGHLILALGRPGRSIRASLGIVSAVGARWRTPAGGQISHYLQTDVARAPGFSGGPLIDVSGKVRGLATTGLLPRAMLGIPSPTLEKVVPVLLTHGRVRRGYLGVGAQPVHLPVVVRDHVGQESGLLLVAVEPGGPAEKAGLMLGDTIVALDGEPVRDFRDLVARLTGDRIGAAAAVRIVRSGRVEDRTVSIGEHP
jgi:S1-C subfamily serine protease